MNGATLTLTATDRLARQLREDASLERSRRGETVWEAPRIASLARWLIDTWTASWPDAQLLGNAQELVLWREAVERDEAGAQLLATAAAAREARRADQLLRRHRIDIDTLPAWQDEHAAFRRWRRHVERRMAQQHWITAADVAGEVARLVAAQGIAVPESIELAGFVSPPVASEQAVLDALAARGTRIAFVTAQRSAPRVAYRRFGDEDAQWRWVVHDLRERLRAAASDPPRIVIALPDAEGPRARAESLLRSLLAPWVARGQGAQPWRWERGRALAEQPVVEALFAALQLRVEDNPPDAVGRVLLATGLWTVSERAATAAADHALRSTGATRVSLARVQALLPAPLAARFEAFTARLRALPDRALPSAWGSCLRELIEALGWPGTESLDTQAYQAVRAAHALFERLGTLDAQLGPVSGGAARDWLAELGRTTRFAPRAEHAQPVLLTTLEEAAALRADVVYLLDATRTQLPLPARPTPFLALEAQRAAGIAESSPERWLARTQAQLARLLDGCAPEVVVGAARVDARGAELQASTLFGDGADWHDTEVPRAIGAVETALREDRGAAVLPDADPVPAVDAAEQAALRPDSALFKAWFESPFFAFCIYRLGIQPLPQPPRGLDARVQGNLVHGALEAVWGVIGDSRALAALGPDRLADEVARAVQASAARHLPESAFGPATRRLEVARAEAVVAQWLAHEARRLDAFTVERRELRAEPVVAGLQLRLRLDRVDRVESPYGARWIVIDYKTGRDAATSGWKTERLREPQLPLYASHAATAAAGIAQVDGICFAHVKDGHPALVAQTNWREKLIEDPAGETCAEWDQKRQGWRIAIENAARGFLAGEAWAEVKIGSRSPHAALLALAGASVDEDAEE